MHTKNGTAGGIKREHHVRPQVQQLQSAAPTTAATPSHRGRLLQRAREFQAQIDLRRHTEALERHTEAMRATATAPVADHQATGVKVSYAEALAGVPGLQLPSTPKQTLSRWVRNPAYWEILGLDANLMRKLKVGASLRGLRLRVAGLIERHQGSRRGVQQVRRGRDAVG